MGNASNTNDRPCVAGVLVGGQGVRLGRPKATLALSGGSTLTEHVVGVARRQDHWIGEVVILGRCADLPTSLTSLRRLEDVLSDGGPLAGLGALLEYAGQRWGLLLACDLPLLQAPLLQRLHDAIGPEHDAVAFRRPNRPYAFHACCALYHPRLLPAALHELRQGRRSLHRLLVGGRAAVLLPTPAEEEMLTNLNTPADYDRLRRRG